MNRERFHSAISFAVPVLLCLALTGVCIWSANLQINAAEREAALRRELQAGYEQTLYQLSDNVNDMQVALKKLRVTGSTAQHVLLLSDVWRLSGAAVANMGNMPASHVDTAELNQFIVRVGDYCNSLNRRILNGGVLGPEEYETIDKLYEAGVQIGNELKTRLDNGAFPTETVTADGYFTSRLQAENPASGTDGAAEQGNASSEQASDQGAANQENGTEEKESIGNYPTLIYDGPFSESNEAAEPRGLGDKTVDEEGARKAALAYLGGGSLTFSGQGEGTIPIYSFTGTDALGRAAEIAVSRTGGQVLWMMAQVPEGEGGVPDEGTVSAMKDAAKKYLSAHGYGDMEATYAQFYDGVGVLNFAAVQDNVILYADLIKVYVERATCTIAGVDANNYLMCHTQRKLPAPQLTVEEARASVNESLSIKSQRLALIPKTPSTEALCYEFKGTVGEAEFIVYINAVTGNEEDIFEILNSDEGQLVV